MQEGPRLVGVDMDALALLDGRANNAQSGSVAAGGQRAGVAVREDSAFPRQQRAAECAHGLAGGNIFLVHGVGFGQDFFLYLDREARRSQQSRKEALHAVDGPEEINGGGAGAGQAGADRLEFRARIGPRSQLWYCMAPRAMP